MFRKIFFVFFITVSFGPTQIAAARQDKAPRAIAALPPAFAKFSVTEALQLIFSDYNPATGRTAKILNEEQKSAKVRIDEAKIWKAQNLERLVIVVGIENTEGTFQEEIDNGFLCGACGYSVGLALFQKNGEALSLVAFQELENAATSGHGETLLDLAPYKLAATETLIGLRSNYMHMGTQSDMLRLYRVENNSLRQVFERDLGEGFESEGITTANKLVLAVLPNAGGFNDFQVKGKTSITDNDGNLLSELPVKERWKFDGTVFKNVTAPTAAPALLNATALANAVEYTSLTEALRQPERVYKLNLRAQGLTTVSRAILHLKNLQGLDLGYNPISYLLDEITQLPNLQSLNLSCCGLTELPETLMNLLPLQELDLRGGMDCEFKNSPSPQMLAVIGRLKNLQKLYLGFLELEQFPRELSELSNLQELYLDFNNLKSLPPEIGKLKNLRNLNLQSNHLKTLPAEIGQLKQLSWLNIGNDLADEGNTPNQFSEAERKRIRTLLPTVKIEFPELR